MSTKLYSYNIYDHNQIVSTRNQLNINCKCMLCKFGLPATIVLLGLDWDKRLEFIFFSLSNKSNHQHVGTEVSKEYTLDEIFQYIVTHFSMLQIKSVSSRQSSAASLSIKQVLQYLRVSKKVKESDGLYWKRKQHANPFIVTITTAPWQLESSWSSLPHQPQISESDLQSQLYDLYRKEGYELEFLRLDLTPTSYPVSDNQIESLDESTLLYFS